MPSSRSRTSCATCAWARPAFRRRSMRRTRSALRWWRPPSAIIAVFLPVSFMGGIVGQFFKQFGLTVAVAVFISLMVARLITPVLAAYALSGDSMPHQQGDGPIMTAYLCGVALVRRESLEDDGPWLLVDGRAPSAWRSSCRRRSCRPRILPMRSSRSSCRPAARSRTRRGCPRRPPAVLRNRPK